MLDLAVSKLVESAYEFAKYPDGDLGAEQQMGYGNAPRLNSRMTYVMQLAPRQMVIALVLIRMLRRSLTTVH